MTANSHSINFNPTYKRIKYIYNNYLSNYVEGSVCIISSSALSSVAFNALEKAVSTLGFNTSAVVFVNLHPEFSDAEGTEGTESTCNDAQVKTGELSAADLFELVEGVDPICVVATDKTAVQAMANAYRHPINLDRMNRVFGRNVAAFTSFDEMLTQKVQKAEAWSILKKLSRL